LKAFSDGVFAIAITLLILEIKIPSAGSGDLSRQLIRQWPSYFAFVVSFAFIGIMWINRHRLFTNIKRSNNALLFLNLLLLLGVTMVPFPTAVLAQHLGQSDQRTAAIQIATCWERILTSPLWTKSQPSMRLAQSAIWSVLRWHG
jgi:uncharacterized membrane protein